MQAPVVELTLGKSLHGVMCSEQLLQYDIAVAWSRHSARRIVRTSLTVCHRIEAA